MLQVSSEPVTKNNIELQQFLANGPQTDDTYKKNFKNPSIHSNWVLESFIVPVFAVPIIEEFNMSYGIPYLWQVLEIHSVGDWWLVRNFAPVTDYKHLDQKGQVMRLVDTVWMHCPEKFVQKLLLHDNYLLLASLYPLLS